MPIYEYQCLECGQKVRKRWPSFSAVDESTLRCPRCGGSQFKRLISRVAVVRSEEARLEALADPAQLGDLDENDPRSIGRWLRKMGQEVGEDLGPEFEEVVSRLEAGQSPEEIEKEMPDLAEGLGSSSDEFIDL